jgi:hypothetical protein
MREARAFMIYRRVDVAPPSAARELREFGLRRGRSAHAPVSASRVLSSFGVRGRTAGRYVSAARAFISPTIARLYRLLPPQLATPTEAAAEKFRKKTPVVSRALPGVFLPVLHHVGFSSVLSFHTRSVSQSHGQSVSLRSPRAHRHTASAHLSVYFKFLFLFTAEEKYTCIDHGIDLVFSWPQEPELLDQVNALRALD